MDLKKIFAFEMSAWKQGRNLTTQLNDFEIIKQSTQEMLKVCQQQNFLEQRSVHVIKPTLILNIWSQLIHAIMPKS